MSKVLITCPCHPSLYEGLRSLYDEVIYVPHLSKEELQTQLNNDYVGIVIATKIPITPEVLRHTQSLQWIARLGSGIDHIDLSYCREHHIQVLTSPEGNAPSVGEFTLASMWAALKHLNRASHQVSKGIWERNQNRGTLLASKKIGIIGFGNMGSALGDLLTRLRYPFFVHDTFKTVPASPYCTPTTLEYIQSHCDIVSLHMDYTPQNYHFANRAFFEKLKQKPIFINTSRGACVDTLALIYALEHQYISYACLDVLENEAIAQLSKEETKRFQLLASYENVIITPHIAGVTEESFYAMSDVLLNKIRTLVSLQKSKDSSQ